MALRSSRSGLATAAVLGICSCVLLLLSALQLFTSYTIDVRYPLQLLPVHANPRQYYWTVGACIILAIALGFLASVALYMNMSTKLSDWDS